jgi:hypothetical protein
LKVFEPVMMCTPVPPEKVRLLYVNPAPAKVFDEDDVSEITIVEVPAVNVAPPVQTVPVPVNVIVRELAASVPAVKITEMADQLSCNVHAPPEPLNTTVPKLLEATVIV